MENSSQQGKIVGQVCTVDNLGRIVIPSTIRKAYDLEKNDSIELIMDEDGILMRKYQPGCVFCGNIRHLDIFKGKLICSSCLKEMNKKKE